MWTADISRVKAIPRRAPVDPPDFIVEDVSRRFRQPGSSARLKPIQVRALTEAAIAGGLVAPIRVGGGKTLLSGLLPVVLGSLRPMLLVPAALVAKTRIELFQWAAHFKVAAHLTIVSYEKIGTASGEAVLRRADPDLIIADEAHKLKNPKAAVTRRVGRVLATPTGDGRRRAFCALTGTAVKTGFSDIWHLARWALGDSSPLPHDKATAEEWSRACGFPGQGGPPVWPGAIAQLSRYTEPPGLSHREGAAIMRSRMTETMGWVSSTGDDECRAEIVFRVVDRREEIAAETRHWIAHLRATATTPDDWALGSPMEAWAYERQLALGFHYVWNPRPPQEWRDARKAWFSAAFETLSASRSVDTEGTLRAAVLAGDPRFASLRPLVEAWERVKPTFTPNVEPRWHSRQFLEDLAERMARSPGAIVWTEHHAFAMALAELTGCPYYGAKGRDVKTGTAIEHDPGGRAIIAGFDSNATGRNLQKWSENIFPAPLGDGADAWEQALGRTHRSGQTSPVVECETWILTDGHLATIRKACSLAETVHATTGNSQKLLSATWEGFDIDEDDD